MLEKRLDYATISLWSINFARHAFVPFARFSIFLIFFWFGLAKVTGASPAEPLAEALTAKTVGVQFFEPLFLALALLECVIGVLFLIPRTTRIVVPLLLLHMAVTCSPLLLVPEHTWRSWLTPTMEGQYIIKNMAVIAAAIGILASTVPAESRRRWQRSEPDGPGKPNEPAPTFIGDLHVEMLPPPPPSFDDGIGELVGSAPGRGGEPRGLRERRSPSHRVGAPRG